MQAETLNQVAGVFRPVNWKRRQRHWTHLSHISFPLLGPRPVVDLLIGLDHSELHRSVQDIAGEPGEPVARLIDPSWVGVCRTDGEWQRHAHHLASLLCVTRRTPQGRSDFSAATLLGGGRAPADNKDAV